MQRSVHNLLKYVLATIVEVNKCGDKGMKLELQVSLSECGDKGMKLELQVSLSELFWKRIGLF